MRGQAVALALVLLAASGARAQSGDSEDARTAEQMIETAREAYSVRQRRADPCPAPVGNEIVVCRQLEDPDKLRVQSPTERAYAAGERPPDPVPQAPYVLGLPQCGVEVTCHRMGAAPPPIYIIDLKAIPEPLPPEEAARVRRAEDAPTPAAASPAELP